MDREREGSNDEVIDTLAPLDFDNVYEKKRGLTWQTRSHRARRALVARNFSATRVFCARAIKRYRSTRMTHSPRSTWTLEAIARAQCETTLQRTSLPLLPLKHETGGTK